LQGRDDSGNSRRDLVRMGKKSGRLIVLEKKEKGGGGAGVRLAGREEEKTVGVT